MPGSSPARPRWPLSLHLAGAAFFALLAVQQVYATFSTPVDLFIHHTYLIEELGRFSIYGLVFYGFSLLVLRFCVVPMGWGVLYAVASWVLFIVAFYPALPLGSSGMMRRIANPAQYEASRQSFVQIVLALRVAGTLGFVALQATLLWHAYRQLRSKETMSEQTS